MKPSVRSIVLGDSLQARLIRFLLIFFILLYAVFVEPYTLQITYNTFDLFDGADSKITVVLISDIHDAYNHPKYFQHVIESINSQDADLILIAGDNVERVESDWEKLEPLKNLKSRNGVYAVLGNDDYISRHCKNDQDVPCADKIENQLESLRAEVLRNEHRILKIKDREFILIGLDDLWAGRSNYTKAASGVPDDLPKIILSHNQLSVRDETLEGRNLVLSGHTHCGQVRLPFIMDFFLKVVGFADVTGGRATINENTDLYVTCGITPGIVRFLAPPEVSVLYLE